MDYASSLSITLRRVLKLFLYFVGVFLAEFGLLGTVAYLPSTNNRAVVYTTLAIGIISFIGSLIYFFRIRFKAPCLSWLQYLWWILGATILSFIIIVLEFIFVPNPNGKPSLWYVTFAATILLYGIALIVIAHLKPSLRYQLNESSQRILKKAPGKQMVTSDLVALLQTEYKYSEALLYQYIGELKDIEQMVIPGTSTSLCRIKGTQEPIAFPQIYSIRSYDLRQNVARALQFLNEENVDIGLFHLSRAFEHTLKAYLVAASTKGVIQNIPKTKKIENLSLGEMVKCVKDNGIITNDAVLTLLRQVRNDRAHGTMPSLAERQLLMKSVPHIAGLYIDYIKFLDDLTHNLRML